VVKHAEASRVTVSLHRTQFAVENGGKQQEAELLVSDDGRGFDPGRVPPNRMGLSIIRERVRDIGATLQIESKPGSGTRIVVVWRDNG
jgi:signal transduction histidine kinase